MTTYQVPSRKMKFYSRCLSHKDIQVSKFKIRDHMGYNILVINNEFLDEDKM